MIEFSNVSKHYGSHRSKVCVLNDVSFSLKGKKNVAVIGMNGSGKSTLIGLMSGALRPNRGEVRRTGRISWPLAFAGGLHPMLTGRQNAKFVARIYHVDVDQLVDEVQDFTELGPAFDQPLRTYSQGMKARLAFGVSMSVKFDCYLVDEIIGVGDSRFRKKCLDVFQSKLKKSRIIMASHSEFRLMEYCDCAILVERGKATFYETLAEGLAAYNETLVKVEKELAGK